MLNFKEFFIQEAGILKGVRVPIDVSEDKSQMDVGDVVCYSPEVFPFKYGKIIDMSSSNVRVLNFTSLKIDEIPKNVLYKMNSDLIPKSDQSIFDRMRTKGELGKDMIWIKMTPRQKAKFKNRIDWGNVPNPAPIDDLFAFFNNPVKDKDLEVEKINSLLDFGTKEPVKDDDIMADLLKPKEKESSLLSRVKSRQQRDLSGVSTIPSLRSQRRI